MPFTLIFLATFAMPQDRELTIRGRVIDEKGIGVEGAVVGHLWSANGGWRDKHGKLLDRSKPESIREVWGNVGRMMPLTSRDVVTTNSRGAFATNVPDIYRAVMAMNGDRGGIALFREPEDKTPLEIRLAPLVKVRGSFVRKKPGKPLGWTHLYVKLPSDFENPLDSDRLVSCGSFDAQFEFLLPPGDFVLQAYNELGDAVLKPQLKITLRKENAMVELGALSLADSPIASFYQRIETAKLKGEFRDASKSIGQAPPKWKINDARGADRNVEPSSFKGKWLLIDLWGVSCRPCLTKSLPELTKFYEDHAADRDRFEIIGICIDGEDGDIKCLADLDKKLAPIIRKHWNGKAIPFPILLDSTYETMLAYGQSGLGAKILVDPSGKIVSGDEKTLAEILKRRAKPPGLSR